MLIPIIKESEKEFEKNFKNSYVFRISPEYRSKLKQHNISSQLALLEGQKKEVEGMKKYAETTQMSTFGGNLQSALLGEYVIGFNSALSQVIQSLEESITYLKTK